MPLFDFRDFWLRAPENYRPCSGLGAPSVTFPNRRLVGAKCGKMHHPANIALRSNVGQGGLTVCEILAHPAGLTDWLKEGKRQIGEGCVQCGSLAQNGANRQKLRHGSREFARASLAASRSTTRVLGALCPRWTPACAGEQAPIPRPRRSPRSTRPRWSRGRGTCPGC